MHILQIIVPFFIAGFGTCFAGIVLDNVQHWDVYGDYDELFLLLPALLGLKGNLQMTLASRFSTHSHLGHIQTKEDLFQLTCANLSLNQCLSIVVSFSASVLVILIHYLTSGTIDLTRSLLIITTALLTSCVTSFILDILMIIVVQVSSLFNINPDNVATPIAASLGDITSLLLCSLTATALYDTRGTDVFYWITILVIVFYLTAIPVWVNITHDSVHTDMILSEPSHWWPIFSAMVISTISGMILKTAIASSNDIALFQPVICGVGGNLVAVQASRLATLLHRYCDKGCLPEGESVCMNPLKLMYSKKPGYEISRVLILIVVPGQMIFYFFCVMANNHIRISLKFLIMYLIGCEVQVAILIYLAYVLTYLLWMRNIDPDSSTIPYLTSISDVLGASIITLICLIAFPYDPTQ